MNSAFRTVHRYVTNLARINSRSSKNNSEEEEKNDGPSLPSFVHRPESTPSVNYGYADTGASKPGSSDKTRFGSEVHNVE